MRLEPARRPPNGAVPPPHPGGPRVSGRWVRAQRARLVLDATVGRRNAVNATLLAGLLLLAAVLPALRRRRRRARRQARLVEDLPDAIDLLVVLVRAGLTPNQAVGELAGRAPDVWRPAFAAVGRRQMGQCRFVDALDELVAHAGPVAQPVLDALAAAERFGQPLATSLDRLSADGRAARRRLHDIRTRQLPVRLSFPLVCCTLPAFILLTIAPLLAGALMSITRSGSTP
ncbi:MAG: hypothetical protein F2934_10200 [Actinobacteria bacterium]|nr:hypothetical protein [Actinomycetota bacterium]